MKKYELKLLLEAAKAENEAMEVHIKELKDIIDKQTETRRNRESKICKLQVRVQELETTIRVLQNI